MEERAKLSELTQEERHELQWRMGVVDATIVATSDLLNRHRKAAEEVEECDEKMRSKWAWGMFFVGAVAISIGRGYEGFGWLTTIGVVLWFLVVPRHFYLIFDLFRVRPQLEQLDWRLWEQLDRWREIGAYEGWFVQLKEMHKPDTGINFNSDEYLLWYGEVRQRMIDRCTLKYA